MGAATERPTGTVTFLFSDIEGSTRLLQRLGARYAEALAEHQRLLREAFAAYGGHEIDTQGDSFFVAFRRAKDAVAAAVQAQRALAAHEWPDGVELRVRMGIHTGEPVAAEERYVGLGVHRAARIGAAAVGGQVLVSETTRSLLRDDPLPDVTLRDLGPRQLKDIDEPERLFELTAPGLVSVELPESASRMSRRRLVLGAAVVTVAVAAGLGAFLAGGGGGGGASKVIHAVGPNEVGVVDTRTGAISAQVPVGAAPNGVAVGDGAIWIANTDGGTVARVDPATETLRQTISVGGSPAGVAVSPGAVWVANGSDGTVSRIDPTTNTVVQTVVVGNGPNGVAYGAGKIWVANSADGTVSELDPERGRVERTLPAAVGVTALTVSQGHVWAVAPASGVVVDLVPGGGSTSIGVGVDPDAIAPAAGAIWVANRRDGTVSRIHPRTRSVTATIQVGHEPDAIAAAGSSVWVANGGDGTLSEIDTSSNAVVKTLALANPPQGLASSATDLYVSVRSSGAADRGGTLRVDFGGNLLDSLDPAHAYSGVSWTILAMTNDGLVGYRRVGGTQGFQLVPDLATALPLPSEAGRTYTLTLRSGIRYSDGRLVEPDDIRRGIERTLEAKPALPTRQYFADIVGASRCAPGKPCDLSGGIVTDRLARTITFHLTASDPDFLTKLALPAADAVPAGTPAGRARIVPATGPYMVSSAKTKQRVVKLVRNPKFVQWSSDAQPAGFPNQIDATWEQPSASPQQIVARQTGSVEKGSEDVALFPGAPPLPKQTLDMLATRFPSQLHFSTEAATWYFFLNTRVAPFDDVRTRQAVQEAFDHAAFGRLLTSEYVSTCSILPTAFPGYVRGCPYGGSETSRLAKARALVRASGRSGERVVVWIPGPLAFEARYMVSLLDSLGFRASMHVVPASKIQSYFATILNPSKRVQTGYIGWFADYPSSLGFFQQLFSCAGFDPSNWQANSNPSGFCNRRIDAEIKHASEVQAIDPPAAVALWQKVGRDILAEAPAVPTYNGRAIALLSKHVGNYQYNPQLGVLLDQLWVH